MKRLACSIVAATLALAPLSAQVPAPAGPPYGGTVSIEPKTDGDADDASTAVFVGALSDALAAKGFTILPDPGHAAYVVQLILHRADVGTGLVRVAPGKASAQPGGAYSSVGAGVTIPLSTGKSSVVPLERTQLELRMTKRGGEAVIWHGAAVTVRAAGTRKGADDATARALSEAVLRSYPAESEGVVGVP